MEVKRSSFQIIWLPGRWHSIAWVLPRHWMEDAKYELGNPWFDAGVLMTTDSERRDTDKAILMRWYVFTITSWWYHGNGRVERWYHEGWGTHEIVGLQEKPAKPLGITGWKCLGALDRAMAGDGVRCAASWWWPWWWWHCALDGGKQAGNRAAMRSTAQVLCDD